MTAKRFTVLGAAADATVLTSLSEGLEALSNGTFDVEAHHSAAGLKRAMETHRAAGRHVPLVIADRYLTDGSGIDALIALTDREAQRGVRKAVLVPHAQLDEVGKAGGAGGLDATIARPWDDDQFRVAVTRLVTEFFLEVDPRILESIPDLVHVRLLAHAFTEATARSRVADEGGAGLPFCFLGDLHLSDDEVERLMIAELDRSLGNPPRRYVPAGALIVAEGDPIDGVNVILEGRVRLFRKVEGNEIDFHHRTAGRILGLLALSRSRPAFFSIEAETDVTLLPITQEQLDSALHDSAVLAAHFTSVLMRSLARRNLQSIERQLETRRVASTRIRESERLAVVGQLAAGVAHELNNPLQGIVAYSHLLLERTTEDTRQRETLEKIVVQADRCRAIVRALLDFSRPQKPRLQPSNINSILAECLELVGSQALFHNIEIEAHLDPQLPRVLTDPSQMEQVFTNLILNAAEAMEGAGRLTIATRVDLAGDRVEIQFRDTGPGIPGHLLEQVFDPFFSTKQEAHGTGLGLSISYGIVREHGGSITAESQPGGGATFLVRVPITAERLWIGNEEEE